MVVGSGTRFLSGISVYSVRLADALAAIGHHTSLLTMRQLLPTRLYPGRQRVGADLTTLSRDPRVAVFDGVDWYWIPSLIRAALFLLRRRPEAIIFQWWTGTVLHTYLVLILLARLAGARVVIEFHEVLDTGEVRLPLWRTYAGVAGAAVVRLAHGFAVHSVFDRELLASRYVLGRRPVAVLPHGPHDHYRRQPGSSEEAPRVLREAPAGACNLLFFGVIRPYKGLEDLVEAFERIPEAEIERFWLTVVGETWEGWTLPTQRITASPRGDRMTFLNRYVTDDELDAYLRGADAVVLPYHRSSLSGPLHVAMGYGLPVVMTHVGGNAEAAEGYGGIRLVPVKDPVALSDELRLLPSLVGQRFEHPHSWGHTARGYDALFKELLGGSTVAQADPEEAETHRPSVAHPQGAADPAGSGGQGRSGMTAAPARAGRLRRAPPDPASEAGTEAPAPLAEAAVRTAILGMLPLIAVTAAVGLLLISVADNAGRGSHPWAMALFWAGLLMVVVPVAVRLLGVQAGRLERLGLVTLLGMALYAVKILHSPAGFTFFDEFLHWATLNDIVTSGHLFNPNNVLPASPFYPGLEILTSPLVSFGLPPWEAGVFVIAGARLLFVVSLFLFYERAGRSARLAGMAAVIYMANPSFLTFDAQFAYESLALPMAAFVLWCVERRETGSPTGRFGLTIAILVGIVAVVTTHHVTAIALTAFLVVWAVVSRIAHRRGGPDTLGVTGPALLTVTATTGWVLYVASITVGYLAPAFDSALGQVVDLIAGEASGRELFRTASGMVPPVWEPLLGYAAVALVLAAMPFGIWSTLRRHGAEPLPVTLVLVSLLYPASLVARLTQSGAELSARSAEFTFLGIGFILAQVAMAAMALGCRRPRTVRLTRIGLPAAAGVLFIGGAIVGVPFWARLPGPYLVAADTRSVEPQGIAAATWAAEHVGPDARFVADRVNRVLLKTYGRQHPISAVGDRVDVKQVFFSTVLGGPEQRLLQTAGVRYVLADQRLTTALPTVGVYIERGEVRQAPHVTPLDPASLGKWETDPQIDRIFDSGDIRVYDIGRFVVRRR